MSVTLAVNNDEVADMAVSLEKSPLVGQTDPIVTQARFNLARATAAKVGMPNLGRWEDYTGKMREAILNFSAVEEVLHHAQKHIPFTHREDVLPSRMVNTWIEVLAMEFPHYAKHINEISDDPRSIPNSLWRVSGGDNYISNMHLWHLRSLFFCLSYVGKPKHILEIGGGYGAFCRLWMINNIHKAERYTIIDLPESLFYAEVVLRSLFGDDVGYLHGKEPPNTKITLVPLSALSQIEGFSADLAVNIGSMQEMSDPWIVYYRDLLDKSDIQWFYSLNYMGDSIHQMRESRNFWGPVMSGAWSSRVINPEPTVVKIMCTTRNFAESLYEKVPEKLGFRDWSYFRGKALSRAVYLEGLDLLRVDFVAEDICEFIKIITKRPYHGDFPRIPKEIYALAKIAEPLSDDAKEWVKVLEPIISGYHV